jgi:hypothetical protein
MKQGGKALILPVGHFLTSSMKEEFHIQKTHMDLLPFKPTSGKTEAIGQLVQL